jgi:uncharacterized repeat protein (TIGR01451 family)
MLADASVATAGTVSVGQSVVYTAAAGETNTVTATASTFLVTVTDSTAPVVAGAGCVVTGPHSADCTTPGSTPATLDLGDQNDSGTVVGAPGTILGGAGNDVVTGGIHADTLDGGEGNDIVRAGAGGGADDIKGGNGIDVVDYSQRTADVSVSLDGVADDGAPGEGANVEADVENVIGGSGDDTLTGNAGPNTLDGGAGDDDLDGGLGPDTLRGGDGEDYADYVNRSAPVTVSLDGSASSGESGEHDTVDVTVENVFGGSGNDTFFGNGDDNGFTGGPGADSFTGGGGFDTAVYSERTLPVTVTMDGTSNDGAVGEGDNVGLGMEDAIGGAGNDSFTGNSDSNLFLGGPGNDVLSGGGGDDILDGEEGADQITGGPGLDDIHGGAGDDSLESKDGEDDELSCGSGNDSAVSDLVDTVNADCEVVHLGPPAVTTGVATSVTASGATLTGTVTPRRQPTTAHFELGTTTAYGTRGNDIFLPSDGGVYSVTGIRTNLLPGTTYHYRLVASNADGEVTGADASFTTAGAPPGAPLVSTGAATNVTTSGATVAGTVNPLGKATTAHFELGTTTAYGSRSADSSIPADVGDYTLSSTWSSLLPGTTYHYRLVASSAGGDMAGADATFTTGGSAPAANLGITVTAASGGLTVGDIATFTVTVLNAGPSDAFSVTVSDAVSAGEVLTPTLSRGTCTPTPLHCDLGTLANGASVTITIPVRATAAGPIANTATVTSATTDPSATDNSATATVEARVAPAVECRVPKLRGKTITAAKKSLAGAHCALGKVSHVYSSSIKRDRIVSQKPAAGAVRAKSTKVAVAISRGPQRRGR